MRKLSLIIIVVLAFVFISARLMTPSPHGDKLKISCDVCHSAKGWKLDREIYSFDHSTTALPLTGKHKLTNCRLCHPTLVFSDAKPACADCHTDLHEQTVGPDCARCHTTDYWIVNNITEIHQRSRFPLLGPHVMADCSGCHKSSSLLRFDPLGIECFDCHQDDYNATTQPNHIQGGYSKNCLECHSINSLTWTSSGIDHSFFPLSAGHAINDCSRCHTGGNFNNLSPECLSCHQADYNTSANPNHTQAQFSTNCTQCHTTNPGWKPTTFDHANFPLTAGHSAVVCTQCHINGNYNNTPNECLGCHQADYDATTNPNHIQAQFPTSCTQCHTTNPGWKPASFDHTTFPLTAGHNNVACLQCHINGNYNNTSKECVSCHLTDYNNSTDPNHISSGFPTTCAVCHTTNPGWKPADFQSHDAQYFPIYSGKHQGEWNACTECHTQSGNFKVFSCIDCHEHNKTDMDDEHSGVGGYSYNSLACYQCHPTGSVQGSFNHNNSGFPLTGAHVSTPCLQCHTNGFSGTTTICSECHGTAYSQTTNPNHTASSIPNTCSDCHTTNPGWKPATFPIHGNYFALTGAHATIANNCVQCHNSNYNNTPNTCVGCHQPAYNQTTNPNHTAIGVPSTCADCHTTNPGWKPATFAIHNNYYVLAGAHVSIANNCVSCHNGNYNSTPNTCVGCHQQDYNQTTNPPHASAQFPTDCASCHTQNVWVPSTFNHDGQYFPIYSGKHQGEWNLCSDCHTTPTNYGLFSCIDCHEHNQIDMNSEHNGVSGYTYNSLACYQCHPNGNAGKMMMKSIDNTRKQD